MRRTQRQVSPVEALMRTASPALNRSEWRDEPALVGRSISDDTI